MNNNFIAIEYKDFWIKETLFYKKLLLSIITAHNELKTTIGNMNMWSLKREERVVDTDKLMF